MVSRSITSVSIALILFLLCGCGVRGERHAPAVAQAYVGPAVLNLRRDISLKSGTVATVKHGDRVEILQQRRVFFRVRTSSGVEGWTSASQLLSAADMDEMKQLTQRAAKMPNQGEASVYDALNVHTQPSAHSPSFMQLKANEKFVVLTHVVAPRIDLPHAPLVPPRPKKVADTKKEAKPSGRIPLPPMPKAPPLPNNWLELSHPTMEDEAAEEGEPQGDQDDASKPPPIEDDWSLVRTASGQTGWALTRKLTMAIPDEVAQYAEGRRIVSYFSLGEVQDGGAQKKIWLWTTVGDGHPPYDFDSFRVFIWSLKRHRYETAYIERKIQGYSPVLVQEIPYSGTGKSGGEPVKYPGFSICMRKQDGSLVARDYVLLTNIVRFAGERACELPQPVINVAALFAKPGTSQAPEQPVASGDTPENRGVMNKLKSKVKGLLHRK